MMDISEQMNCCCIYDIFCEFLWILLGETGQAVCGLIPLSSPA